MENLINEIIAILNTDGEVLTDGECLDAVASLLEQHGYTVFPRNRRWNEWVSWNEPFVCYFCDGLIKDGLGVIGYDGDDIVHPLHCRACNTTREA